MSKVTKFNLSYSKVSFNLNNDCKYLLKILDLSSHFLPFY